MKAAGRESAPPLFFCRGELTARPVHAGAGGAKSAQGRDSGDSPSSSQTKISKGKVEGGFLRFPNPYAGRRRKFPKVK